MLAVHHYEAPDAIQDIWESAGGQLVYDNNEASPILISKRAHPPNTNLLASERTYLFRLEDQDRCEAVMNPPLFHSSIGSSRQGIARRFGRPA